MPLALPQQWRRAEEITPVAVHRSYICYCVLLTPCRTRATYPNKSQRKLLCLLLKSNFGFNIQPNIVSKGKYLHNSISKYMQSLSLVFKQSHSIKSMEINGIFFFWMTIPSCSKMLIGRRAGLLVCSVCEKDNNIGCSFQCFQHNHKSCQIGQISHTF